VFSHDELLCKMVAQPEHLELCLLVVASEDCLTMVNTEQKLWSGALQKGVDQHQRELFELASDEERQCSICNTYCFLSAIRCPCSPGKVACLHHMDDLCSCPASKKVLRYRYTMDELQKMLSAVQKRAEGYQSWANQVERVLDGQEPQKIDLEYLHALTSEGSSHSFESSDIFAELKSVIQDAEKCANTAVQIALGKHKTRSGSVWLGVHSSAVRYVAYEPQCWVNALLMSPPSLRPDPRATSPWMLKV